MAIIKKEKSVLRSNLADFFDIDAFFRDDWMTPRWYNQFPAANLKETDTDYIIEMAAPGLKKSDFKINLDHDVLSISAEKEMSKDEKEGDYTRKEYSFESFNRSFMMPDDADAASIDAHYADGILTLKMNRKGDVKAKRKTIKVG